MNDALNRKAFMTIFNRSHDVFRKVYNTIVIKLTEVVGSVQGVEDMSAQRSVYQY